MQKDPARLLYREEGITKIFPRMKLLVFIMILSITLASAKSYPAETDLQQVVVTGTVTDEQGLPVIGSTVVVKGTTLGTLTDGAGKYTLTNVPQNATLVFTFIGMTPQEVPVRGQTRVDVVLKEMLTTLEEVVVIGYGTQKKESIVGAIAQTTNAQLQQAGSVTNLTQALTGRLPGVITITSTGEPGGTVSGEDATQIYIRGQNTWNGGQPLIIVDGVERSMSNLDVSEVESISVLKDASATAVFGVKGANGVILITTKRGSLGKTKLSFAYNATAKMTSKLPTLMDSYNAQLIRNESIERETVLAEGSWGDYIPFEIVSRYKLPQAPSDVPIFPNVDWEKALFRDVGWSQRATLNVQGGTTFVNYFASLSYFHEGDMFQDYQNFKGYSPSFPFDRFNFRSNLDFKLTKTTVLKVNLSGFYSNKKTSNSWDSGIWRAVYCLPPDTHIPQFDDGVWGYNPLTASWGNPVESLYNSGLREQRSTELNSDFSLDQNLSFITKGLTARAFLVYDNSIDSQGGINDEAYALNQKERWLNWRHIQALIRIRLSTPL